MCIWKPSWFRQVTHRTYWYVETFWFHFGFLILDLHFFPHSLFSCRNAFDILFEGRGTWSPGEFDCVVSFRVCGRKDSWGFSVLDRTICARRLHLYPPQSVLSSDVSGFNMDINQDYEHKDNVSFWFVLSVCNMVEKSPNWADISSITPHSFKESRAEGCMLLTEGTKVTS